MIKESIKRLPFIIILSLTISLYTKYAYSEPLPTNSLGRVSYVEGSVEVKAEDIEKRAKVILNMPILPGDLVTTGEMSRVEIEMANGTRVRAASRTSFIMDSPGDDYYLPLIRLNSGRIGIRTMDNLQLIVDGPGYSVTSKGPALFHLRDEEGVVEISVKRGDISVEGKWGRRLLNGGMTAVIRDNRIMIAAGIVHDGWITEFNEREVNSPDYLNSSIKFGQYELETCGRWIYVPVYGYIWRPNIYWGWAPYVNGYWLWRAKAGWIWVSFEPWGWLPYHYGRWIYMPAWGWCWVPGTEWGLWIPGAVYWIYGPGWIAWVPLAPGEVFLFDSISVVRPINCGFPGGVVVVERHAIKENRIVVKPIKLADNLLKKGRVVQLPPLNHNNGRNGEFRVNRGDEIRVKSSKRVEMDFEKQKGSRIVKERGETSKRYRDPIAEDFYRRNIEKRGVERSIKYPIIPSRPYGGDTKWRWQNPGVRNKNPGGIRESRDLSSSWMDGRSGFYNKKIFSNINGLQKFGVGFRSVLNPKRLR